MTERTLTRHEGQDQEPPRDRPAPSPFEVAQRWVSAVGERELDVLRDLYEVGAAMHTADGVMLGQERIATAVLASADLPDADAEITVGREGMVTLASASADHHSDQATRLRVRRGRIVEQWIGEHYRTSGGLAAVPMNMSTAGDVTPEEHDLVWEMVDKLVSLRDEPVARVDVRLIHQPEPGRVDPVALRVTIAMSGGSVRASARTGDVRSAVAVVERRLKERLRRRAERRFATRDAEPSTRAVNMQIPDRRFERLPADREIVRNKSVSPGPSSLEEATFDLTSMGYDFFLYVDIETDDDAVVARTDDGRFVAHISPPVATVASARERLDAGNEPFVFFLDDRTRRGNVLYRRFDGHYGLIVPADA